VSTRLSSDDRGDQMQRQRTPLVIGIELNDNANETLVRNTAKPKEQQIKISYVTLC
jgi:hypothetical protein